MLQWSSRSIETIELYTHQTEYKLCSITRAVEAESCTDVHCINLSHIDAIDNLYCDIVTKLKSAARDSVDTANENARGKPNNIPGWNDYVKGLHSQARVKFKRWCDMGKPRGGPVVDDMRAARKEFKYALRSCRNNKAQLEAGGLAKSLVHKEMRGFWKAIHRTTNSKISSANTVGGEVGSADVLKMWHEHYGSRFGSSITGFLHGLRTGIFLKTTSLSISPSVCMKK